MSTIYEEPFKKAVTTYRLTTLSKFTEEPPELNLEDGKALKEAISFADQKLREITEAKPTEFSFDFNAITEEALRDDTARYQQLRAAADADYEGSLNQLNSSYQSAVQSAQAAAEASTDGLTKAYDELLTYKDKVKDAVNKYDIKPSDLSIDEEALTRDDMEALVATAIAACKKMGNDHGVRAFIQRVTEPPENVDTDSRIWWAALLLVAVVLLAPFLFFGIVWYLGTQLRNVHMNVEGLRIADKLMYGINFQRFRDDPHIENIPTVDTTEIDAIREAAYAEAEMFNPEAKRAELQASYMPLMEDFANQIQEANKEAQAAFKTAYLKWSSFKANAEAAYNEFRANMKTFADIQSQHMVLNYNATVGLEEEVIETTMPYLNSNMVFANRDPLMLQFQKLLLANMLLNVQPTHLKVTIYDPERLGQDYATFLDELCKDYIKVETKDVQKLIDECRSYAQDSFRILDTKTIEEFNNEAEEKGMVTRDYRLLLIASPDEQLYKNEAFISLMQTSVRAGVHVWMVGHTPIDGCLFFAEPFDMVQSPYPVSQELISRCMATYIQGIKDRKDNGIAYISSFQEKYLPEEKWWTENCDKGTKVNLGLQDGDPSKGYDILIGDMPVHALAGGATGAGKSAFLNQMLASLITRYPPSALDLILIDFKNVEFVQLKDKENYSRIPHASILAGTKDGEYALSIFKYLLEDMEKRNEKFQEVGAKKLEDYNAKMRGAGTPEKCIPRTLLIIDEFQVMFSLDQKIVGEITGLIQQLSKLGRSAGVHMFFTSQSMTGTMSKDVKDQFSLRIALRCSADTSSELLGSPIASTITSKFGYLYSNTNAGSTQDSTHLWRTPFLAEELWYDDDKLSKKIEAGKFPEGTETILTKVQRMCAERSEINRHAYFYDSKEVWTRQRLVDLWEEYHDVLHDAHGTILLGERTAFSTKKMPTNFRLTRADGENLFIVAENNKDLCDIISTVYFNLTQDPDNVVLMNSADVDYHAVLELESKVAPQYASLTPPMPTPNDWFAFLQSTITKRKKEGMEGKKPIYFFAVRWEKQGELFRGDNYKNMEVLKAILQDGPGVDVHIIFIAQNVKDVKRSYFSLFNHRICGQCSDETGYAYIDFGHTQKLYDREDAPVALYVFGGEMQKFKIYSFEYIREFEKRELDI